MHLLTLRVLIAHDRHRGAGGEGLIDEVVAVEAFALDRDVNLAGLERPRVDVHAGERRIGVGRGGEPAAGGDAGEGGGGPEPVGGRGHTPTRPAWWSIQSRSAAAACSRSSKCRFVLPMIW